MCVKLRARAWSIVPVKLDIKFRDKSLQHRFEVFLLDSSSDQWVLFDRYLVILTSLDACLQ